MKKPTYQTLCFALTICASLIVRCDLLAMKRSNELAPTVAISQDNTLLTVPEDVLPRLVPECNRLVLIQVCTQFARQFALRNWEYLLTHLPHMISPTARQRLYYLFMQKNDLEGMDLLLAVDGKKAQNNIETLDSNIPHFPYMIKYLSNAMCTKLYRAGLIRFDEDSAAFGSPFRAIDYRTQDELYYIDRLVTGIINHNKYDVESILVEMKYNMADKKSIIDDMALNQEVLKSCNDALEQSLNNEEELTGFCEKILNTGTFGLKYAPPSIRLYFFTPLIQSHFYNKILRDNPVLAYGV